VGV
jgi:hypothetical protein